MKTGYHAVYENNYLEAIDHAKEFGFDFVQYDLGVPTFFLDALSEEELYKIREYASNKRVEITFHAPGDNVSLFCDYPLIREGILKQFKMIVKKAGILNARHITIHAGAYPSFKKSGTKNNDYTEAYRDYYENILYENLKALILESKGILINLENHNLNPLIINTAKRLIKEGHALYLTLDTAKLYGSNLKLIEGDLEFLKEYKANIREIHIHDRNEQFGSHQIPGTGVVDFNLLKEFMLGDEVYLNYEVRPVEAAEKARKALEQM